MNERESNRQRVQWVHRKLWLFRTSFCILQLWSYFFQFQETITLCIYEHHTTPMKDWKRTIQPQLASDKYLAIFCTEQLKRKNNCGWSHGWEDVISITFLTTIFLLLAVKYATSGWLRFPVSCLSLAISIFHPCSLMLPRLIYMIQNSETLSSIKIISVNHSHHRIIGARKWFRPALSWECPCDHYQGQFRTRFCPIIL